MWSITVIAAKVFLTGVLGCGVFAATDAMRKTQKDVAQRCAQETKKAKNAFDERKDKKK